MRDELKRIFDKIKACNSLLELEAVEKECYSLGMQDRYDALGKLALRNWELFGY